MTTTAPVVWAVLSTKTGDNAQVDAVTGHLRAKFGWETQIKRLVFKPGFDSYKLPFLASLYHVDADRSDALNAPWPDLVLTVGWRPAMAALWIRKRSAGRTRVVLLGRPKGGVQAFDLVIAPPQYQIPDAPNLIRLSIPLMRVNDQQLADARRAWQPRLAPLGRPLVAVLVGAATRPFRLDASVVTDLVREAARLAGTGSLYVTTSRRTPADVVGALRSQLPETATLYEFGSPEPNPYLGLLALADRFLVTGDSTSMLTEVAKLSRPLVIFDLPIAHGLMHWLQGLGHDAARLPGVHWIRSLGRWLGIVSYPRDLSALHRRLFDAGLATRRGDDPDSRDVAVEQDPLDSIAERIQGLVNASFDGATPDALRMSLLDRWRWRLTLSPLPRGRGLLIIGPRVGAMEDEVLARIHADHPRLNQFLLDGTANGTQPLTHGDAPVPSPLPISWLMRRYLRRLKLQAIVVRSQAPADPRLLAAAVADGIKLTVMGLPHPSFSELSSAIALCSLDAADQSAADDLAIAQDSRLVDGTPKQLFERLTPLLVSKRAPGKLSTSLQSRLLRRVEEPPLKWFTRDRFEAVRSLDELNGRLDHPRTIMCLGNGPSSEDPELLEMSWDALFRVNHSWLTRRHHTHPDVIFTGKRDTLKAYPRPVIYGFQTQEAAHRVMLRSIGLNALGGGEEGLPFVTAEGLGCLDFDAFDPYKPTNGAVMIATAAALRPKRLIVAGVDLFSDPRGSYPGDTNTPNAYTIAHDRNSEADFILRTLADFLADSEGEVVIAGDVLRERWHDYLAEPG